MPGKIFGVLVLLSLAFALPTGNSAALAGAVFEGASAAVTLTLSLAGTMCLFGGIMEVLREAGAIRHLARVLRPFLAFFFPNSPAGQGAEEIAACVAANLLGIGNASTPLALAALDKMRHSSKSEPPTCDMITLTVMNTAPLCLLPTTILSLRAAAGAADPFAVVPLIWICSAATSLFALCLARLAGALCREP